MPETVSDAPYTNREIREKWNDISTSMSTFSIDMSNGFSSVTKRQDISNGRTSKLELRQAYMNGAMAVLTLLAIPILGWSLYVLVNIDSKINNAVIETLSSYEINK